MNEPKEDGTLNTNTNAMTVDQAEELLAELRTREAAVTADMAAEWDEAYQIAFGAYMTERNFRVQEDRS